MTLAERLASLNSSSREYMAANPGCWSGLFNENLSHWANLGITTAEQFDAYLDSCSAYEAEELSNSIDGLDLQ